MRDEETGWANGRLGGATAALWGQAKWEPRPVSLNMDWSWLDGIDTHRMHELDRLVSRTCMPEMRADYLTMLSFGLE